MTINNEYRADALQQLAQACNVNAEAANHYLNCLDTLITLQQNKKIGSNLHTEFMRHRSEFRRVLDSQNIDGVFSKYLIEAEFSRLNEDHYRALEHYDRATKVAQSNAMPLEETLVSELTALLYLDLEKDKHAAIHLDQATALRKTANLPETTIHPQHDTRTGNKTMTSQTVYEDLVENAVDIIWVSDNTGCLTYISPQWTTLFGFDLVKSIGTAAMSYVHPLDYGRVDKAWHNLCRDKSPKNFQFRHRCEDGSYTWVMVRANVIYNETGQLTGTQGILRDISEQKAMELALQETQDRLQHTAENLPGMIVRRRCKRDQKDNSQELLYVGLQCRHLFEVEPEDAKKNPALLDQRIHPEDLKTLHAKVAYATDHLTIYRHEYRVVLPEKGTIWCQSISKPTIAENGDILFDGIITEITELKHTELKLQQANELLEKTSRMKDVFLANMSHELRTPLTAIMSNNEGLRSGMFGPLTDEQKESLLLSRQSTQHLLDLIEELFDLSKIEAGSCELNISEIDTYELCKTCCRMVATHAEAKTIRIQLQAPTGLRMLHADAKRLRQILVNLLNNAIKFSNTGDTVLLSVSAQAGKNKQPDHLRFSVVDNGIGINEADKALIFEPFHQIQNTLNRGYEGLGLGLALVKRFAELHQGSVGVESQSGSGSTFYVDMPAHITQPDKHQKSFVNNNTLGIPSPSTHAANNKATNKQLLILLAEDNDSVAHAITRYLTVSGHRIIRAIDGDIAVKMTLDQQPDIVLMDIQMPHVHGLEAIRRIRNNSACSTVPIIALTGLAMDGDERRCIEAGADRYLSKPYRMHILAELVQQLTTLATETCKPI